MPLQITTRYVIILPAITPGAIFLTSASRTTCITISLGRPLRLFHDERHEHPRRAMDLVHGRIFRGTPSYSYNWSFGDSPDNETVQNPPAHQYTIAATYLVNLIIQDANNAISNYSIEIVVSVDIEPVASFDADPMSIISGQWVQFNDTSTPGNGPLAYQWNFGDGPTNATGQNVTHQYNSPDEFTVVLTVNDTDGDISVFSLQITVVPDTMPGASFIAIRPRFASTSGFASTTPVRRGTASLATNGTLGTCPTTRPPRM